MAGTAAFIDILPNLNGFGGKLVQGAQSQVAAAGTRLGGLFAKSMDVSASKTGADGVIANLEAAERKATAAVKQATKEIATARDQQTVAALNLQAAERRLDEIVLRNGRNSSQAVKAQAQVQSARSKARTATERLSDAENALREASNAAKETTRQLEAAQTQASNAENKHIGVLSRLRDALASSSNAGGSLTRQSKLSAGAIGMIGGVASQISGRVIDAFSGIGGQIAEASDATDKFKQTLSFAGIGGKDIDALTKQTQRYADQTVYDLADIQNTTAQLAANGVPHYEQLAEAAGNLNAVAGGNAETYKSVAMVLTQTAGAGKLTTENWNQLADAIPGASGKLQDAMKANGAYTGNFRDAMEQGQISADEFNKAIMQLGTQDVAKQAATSTSTIEGAWGNLQATVTNIGTQILNKAKPMITGAMSAIGDALANGFSWLQQNGGTLIPIIAGIGAAFGAWAVLTIIMQVAGWVTTLASAIRAAGLAMVLLNAVMAVNPFVLIAAAVGVVVAALTWFFTQTDVGRRAWAAFTGFLSSTAAAVGAFFTGPFVQFLTGVWSGIVSAWQTAAAALGAVFNVILTAAKIAFTLIATIVLTPWQLAINTLGAAFTWLNQNVFQPGWTAIQTIAYACWQFISQNVIIPFQNGLQAMGAFLTLLYTDYIQPVWTLISGAFSTAWNFIKTMVFDAWNAAITNLSAAWGTFSNAATTIWNMIQNTASSAWGWLDQHVITPFKNGVDRLAQAFDSMKTIAVNAWNGLKDAASAPVSFIVNTVYTNGIQKVWNGIANAVGLDLKLPDAKFATGGINPGYAPGHDTILALTSPGEAWMVPEWVKAVGAGNIYRWNALARRQGPQAVRRDMGMQAYADGGIVGKAKDMLADAADAIGSFITDPAGTISSRILDPVKGLLGSIGAGDWGRILAQLPIKIASGLIDKAKSLAASLFTPADTANGGPISWQGGAGVEQWRPLVLEALAMLGQSASWADTVLRRMNQESGGNPNAVNDWDSNAAAGIPSQGLMQVIPPTFAAYAGPFAGRGILDPMANIYAGINYAIHRYGSIAGMNRAGGYALGGVVPDRPTLYDKGGWLPQGRTLVDNHTGSPELVLNPEQARTWRQERGTVEYKPTYIIQGLSWDDVEAKISARSRRDMAAMG